ncbi:ATP-binding protein [Cellulophaga tyrosinoxydans]|uniref:histidine kinase n=1 Tax=Cellulophaga tyrosinoxydans TaxID=504486 RepID=A0A1W1YVT2_9FLAO|nr:ATP-binding protein [Cellulophaga tyrosinoxydans]SMC40192.1 Signal transduction histidine kinase [Cellulophaga tyrosinoxydans]
MLKKYQEAYTTKNVQFVLTDLAGNILDSDQTFLPINKKGTIYDVHPFFYCFSSIATDLKTEVFFSCVHLNFDGKAYITDIKFIKKEEGVLIIISDYTQHYEEYQAIAQARNESIINGELIAIKNAELEEREKFKNSFIRNFSHELRNPLTSIISITKIISDTELTDQQQNMLSFLKESNANLKLLLDDIMSISMISSGRLVLRNNVFSLPQMVDLINFTYKARANESDLQFDIKTDKKIPEFVEGDRLRLFQIITNLIDNAFKYTNSGKVNLEIQFNQKRANKISLRFEVKDTGIGIPEDKIESIFESFSQLNQSSLKSKGTGLGLSIVKGLLHLMNSEIKVQSKPGKGSTFYFDIVLKQPIPNMTKPQVKMVAKKKETILKLRSDKKYKILLAEDDINVQTVLFKLLLDTKYFSIDVVSDGALVMEQLINNEYDLLLIDINLPNVTGDQVARLIRDFPFKNIKNIPIIGITAYAFEDNLKTLKSSGMNAILSKPFELEELIEILFKYLK